MTRYDAGSVQQLPRLTSAEFDALLREDLASFIRACFGVVVPGVQLVWADYLDLIASRLRAVVDGRIRNLIITVPPRHLKSICTSVALPAFFLGHNPGAEVMAVSYGQELARTFADQTRKVMLSPFYQRIFGTRLVSPRQASHLLRTRDGGTRRATSIDGAATGVGADLLIFDDPQKPGEILSDAIRKSTNEAFETTFLSRRNNPATCRMVIVMQRLHEDDFVGHVLGLGGDWQVLNLPAVAEADECYDYTTFQGKHLYWRFAGDALHARRVPLSELNQIRARIGETAWATQYMQRPAPAGGGIVKIAWFRRYQPGDLPQKFDRIVQSWDTANKINEWNDYSVCTTWGAKDGRFYLLNVFRKRLLYPDLMPALLEQANLHEATIVLLEDRASGTQLLQDLRRGTFSKFQACDPGKDKLMRMADQTAPIENGFVYIPAEAHWLDDYLHEMLVFPNGKFDDQVDSTSQALAYLNGNGSGADAWISFMRNQLIEQGLEVPTFSDAMFQ